MRYQYSTPPGEKCGLGLNQFKIHVRCGSVDANPYLTIGIYRRWIFTADTAGDDFREKHPYCGLKSGCILAGSDDSNRDIAVVDDTAVDSSLLQWQAAGGQGFEFTFQGSSK